MSDIRIVVEPEYVNEKLTIWNWRVDKVQQYTDTGYHMEGWTLYNFDIKFRGKENSEEKALEKAKGKAKEACMIENKEALKKRIKEEGTKIYLIDCEGNI